jgi:hypothetical protein
VSRDDDESETKPKAKPPVPTEAAPRRLEGVRTLWALLPATVMVALTLVPSVAAHEAARLPVWVAAGVSALLVLVLMGRRPLEVVTTIRRQHYMQAITQAGVFIYWGIHWEPVAGFLGLVLVQLAFAYQIDLLVAWWRGDRVRLGFGPFPIVFSINLFMWFRDDVFAWQLVLVLLCYLAKHVIVWTRDGVRQHVFNPSSFGLAVISIGLLVLGAHERTYGREIALSQEAAPLFIHVLFALGLFVQLQFRVVMVTAAAAVTTWLLGALFLRVTGVYMFATTDIPAAVFLGMLLLVTDPSTSPRGHAAKLLFGAAYGVLVFGSFPLLEAMGSLGYYDKLLPVPLLNLLVRRFEGWGTALGSRFRSSGAPRRVSARRNVLHVAIWAAVFGLLVGTDAVGKGHPGREIAFWQHACEDGRFRACTTYFDLLTSDCDAGRGEACHNLGVELLEREQRGQSVPDRPARGYLERACTLGVDPSCRLLAAPRPAVASGPAGPPAPPSDPVQATEQACEAGAAAACHALADALDRGAPGLPRDRTRARALYQRGCELGSVPSCSSFAALEMQAGGDADTEAARKAFEKACELGDAPGCANLAGIYLLGHGVDPDAQRAAELNDRACGMGLGVACARLAEAYAKGQGVAVDEARARELVAQACTSGFQPACGTP